MKAELDFVIRRIVEFYNRKYYQELELREKDRVYLLRRNIKTKRLSNKLDYKKLRPFKIIRVIKGVNYKLVLSKTISIYLVFYISLLELVLLGVLLVLKIQIESDQNKEYEIESILDY